MFFKPRSKKHEILLSNDRSDLFSVMLIQTINRLSSNSHGERRIQFFFALLSLGIIIIIMYFVINWQILDLG